MEITVLKVKAMIASKKFKEALKFMNKKEKTVLDDYQKNELFA